ncbi:MAG: protein kinase [Acidobacteriota bacterium]
MPMRDSHQDPTLPVDSSAEEECSEEVGVVVGKEIGNYRVVEKIGQGGMGVVYRAQDSLLGRTVAIKVMNPKEAGAPDFERRFVREAKTASSLNHPNITQIYQFLDEAGTKCIVMEYLPGPSLEARMKKGGALDAAEAVRIVEQVAMALDAAQAEGLVHRDIKPANISFDQNGVVKLLDFGLAKWHDPSKAGKGYQTETGHMVVGTARYMSPEMILQDQVDTRGDLFSLGIVFYEMLTEEHPYPGKDHIAILNRIVHGTMVPAETYGVPADIATILARMLERNPADRYQTARALLDDLSKARRWLPTGRTVIRRRRVKVRHVKRAAALAGIVAAVAAGSYYLFVWRAAQERARQVETLVPPAITVLPIANRTGDESVGKLMLPLTHLLIASLRPLRSIDVLDLDRLATVAGALDPPATGPPDRDLYARLRRIRPTAAIVQPALFKTDGEWEMTIDVRDPLDGRSIESRKCTQSVGVDAEANLGVILDCAAREIVIEFGQGRAERLSTTGRLEPGRVAALQAVAEGVRSSLQQEHVKAREAFQKALEADPKDPMIMVRLSAENRALGYHSDAERYARQASSLINESMSIVQGYEIDATLAEVTYQYDRARDVLQKLINLYPRRPEYQYRLGEIEHQAGRYGEAEKAWRNAILLAPDYTPALIALAGLCVEQARYPESIEWYNKASRVFEGIGSKEGQAAVLCGLGDIDWRQNRVDAGRRKYETALGLYQAQNNEYGIAVATSGIGVAYQMQGDLQHSKGYLDDATARFQKMGNLRAQAEQRINGALQFLAVGDYNGALAASEDAISIGNALGNVSLLARSSEQKATALYYMGRCSEAEPLLSSAIDGFKRLSFRRLEGRATSELADVYYATGRLDECLQLCALGTLIAGEIDDAYLGERLNALRAEIACLRADYAQALKYREQRMVEARKNNGQDDVAYSAYNAARACAALGDYSRCIQLLDEADSYFRKIDNPAMHGLAELCRLNVTQDTGQAPPDTVAAMAQDVGASLGRGDNQSLRLLGDACRALYCGTAEETRRTIIALDAHLKAQAVDMVVRVEMELLLCRLCARTEDRKTGLATAQRMLRTAENLKMPEYGCEACLWVLKFEVEDQRTRRRAVELGRKWYREVVSLVPENLRDGFRSRRSIAEMELAFQ